MRQKSIKRVDNERSTERIVKAIIDPDRTPLAPLALRGDKTSCFAPRKFLDLILAINAQAFLEKWYYHPAILILNSPGDCAYWSLFGQWDADSFDVISG